MFSLLSVAPPMVCSLGQSLRLPLPCITPAHQGLSREHLQEPQEVAPVPQVAVQVSHPACHPGQVGVHPLGEGFLLHGFSLICNGNKESFLSFKDSVPALKHQRGQDVGWELGMPERAEVTAGVGRAGVGMGKEKNSNLLNQPAKAGLSSGAKEK